MRYGVDYFIYGKKVYKDEQKKNTRVCLLLHETFGRVLHAPQICGAFYLRASGKEALK